MKLATRVLGYMATLGLLAALSGTARADIVVPVFTSGTDLNTDTGNGFDPNNLTTDGGLSASVPNGDTLAHAQSVTMPAPDGNFGDFWETNSNGNNYFDGNPTPVFVFDLGKDYAINNLLFWQNPIDPGNGNQARDFSLRFSTDANGPNFSGAAAFSGTLSDVNSLPSGVNSAQTFAQSGNFDRYIEVTLNNNYFNILGVGGDRVGLGKIRVDGLRSVPEPATLTLSLLGGAGLLCYGRRRRARG